ncbi:MAG TPA: hypothetical protein VGJ20_34235 [Xanthobacteraceae bacterium]|jgi:hypothetical protein
MYLFLSALGAVISAMGVAALAAGISISMTEHHVDPAVVTPAIVAVVGGLIVVALGMAARAFRRLEKVLVTRVLPAAPPKEQNTASTPESANRPPPVPPQPQPEAPVQLVPVAAAVEQPAEAAADRVQDAIPNLLALAETGAIVEQANISLLPRAPVQAAAEEVREATHGFVAARAIGAASRIAPWVDVNRRQSIPPPPKVAVFDSFWPTGPRVPGDGRVTPAPAVAPRPLVPAQGGEPPHDASAAVDEQGAPAAALSILKSGVVDGMAYTLYSDGSIEAQLPHGTLRFGSIGELRNHIENG